MNARRCALYGRELTNREMQVLHLVSHGLTNAEIGRELSICATTAKTTIGNIFEKFGGRGRAGIVGMAYRSGLLGSGCCDRPEPQPPTTPHSLGKPKRATPYDHPAVARSMAVTVDDWVDRFTDSPETFNRLCENMRSRTRKFLGADVSTK